MNNLIRVETKANKFEDFVFLFWKKVLFLQHKRTDLQQFDELLKQAQKNGSITIEKNMIVGIDNKVFEL